MSCVTGVHSPGCPRGSRQTGWMDGRDGGGVGVGGGGGGGGGGGVTG